MAESEQPSTSKLLRAWERLSVIKNQLVKQGLLNGDATPAAVLEKLKQVIPTEML